VRRWRAKVAQLTMRQVSFLFHMAVFFFGVSVLLFSVHNLDVASYGNIFVGPLNSVYGLCRWQMN
jgi:hypothetical protein